MIKKIIAVLSALALVTGIFTSCGKIGPDLPTEVTAESTTATAKEITTGEIGVIHDTEFDNVYIDLTIDEFNALGFEFGDSVNVEFNNGRGLEDIPYYSGYYVPVGQPLACGYPGYPHVRENPLQKGKSDFRVAHYLGKNKTILYRQLFPSSVQISFSRCQ